jgi:hypothetical protein
MDFSKVNRKDLIIDLVKFACFNIVANILMNVRDQEPIFSEKFVYSLVFLLTGFAVYHIVIAPQLLPRL